MRVLPVLLDQYAFDLNSNSAETPCSIKSYNNIRAGHMAPLYLRGRQGFPLQQKQPEQGGVRHHPCDQDDHIQDIPDVVPPLFVTGRNASLRFGPRRDHVAEQLRRC